MKKTLKIEYALKELNLTEIPVCIECGADVKFVNSKYKNSDKSRMSSFGGWKLFCGLKCSRSSKILVERRRQTNIIKYGTQSWAQSNKAKEILSKPWSEEKKANFKVKLIETYREKYGVDFYSQTSEYINKRNETTLDRYGVTNTFQLVDKIKETNLMKYGETSYNKTIEGRNKLSVNSAMRNPDIKYKSKINRMLNSISDTVLRDVLINKDKDKLIQYLESLNLTNRFEIANKLNISYSYLNNILRQFDIRDYYLDSSNSHYEKEIYDWIKTFYNKEVILNDRSLINPKELDLYLPESKLAIEFNGIHFHSEISGNKDPEYHLRKTEECERHSVQLLHIFENEWLDLNKQKIWKSIIKHKLGLTNRRIFARKCTIKEISSKESRIFLDTNHLSGFAGAEIHYGIFYKDELVAVLNFGKSRFKTGEFEIIRFASLIDTVVVGALGKFMKLLPDNTITYADRRYSSILNVGYSNFFSEVEYTVPNWFGYDRRIRELKSRFNFQIHKLKDMFNYDEKISVIDNMYNNGYDRIWDCGNLKFKK